MFLVSAALLGELTVEDVLGIALGPSAWIGSGFSGGGEEIVGVGVTHRVGPLCGGRGAGTRQGLSLALQLDVAWLDAAWSPGSGDGWHAGLSLHAGWDTF